MRESVAVKLRKHGLGVLVFPIKSAYIGFALPNGVVHRVVVRKNSIEITSRGRRLPFQEETDPWTANIRKLTNVTPKKNKRLTALPESPKANERLLRAFNQCKVTAK